jgi:RimJ/RimL family protein N-acetyltransferase
MTSVLPDSDHYPWLVVTDRLVLRPITTADVDGVFPIFSDPDGWWYDPDGRHVNAEMTARWIERAMGRWVTDGLSYWAVRRRSDNLVIGVGGAQRHKTGTWNLNYRIATAEQGRGYATEMATAACDAAHHVDPAAAFIAWVAEHNTPSRRVAERLGLINHGLLVDLSDGQQRLAYADRTLDETFIEAYR